MRDAIYPKQSDVCSNEESIQDDMSARQVQDTVVDTKFEPPDKKKSPEKWLTEEKKLFDKTNELYFVNVFHVKFSRSLYTLFTNYLNKLEEV